MSEAVKTIEPLKVSIEGNIAAGKSTFLEILAEEMNILAVLEPVSKWQEIKSSSSGLNLLDIFYKDPKRYSYLFQTFAFLSRMQSQLHPYEILEKDTNNKKMFLTNTKTEKAETVIVFERSVLSDRYCFAKNCFETGIMSEVEHKVYETFHTFLVEEFKMLRLNGIIYLRTNPETCVERLKKRNRSEEKDVDKDYLETLHKKHEEWLLEEKTMPVLILDCNDEFEKDPVRRAEMQTQVRDFLKKIR